MFYGERSNDDEEVRVTSWKVEEKKNTIGEEVIIYYWFVVFVVLLMEMLFYIDKFYKDT